MKTYLLLLFSICSFSLFAQPANDDCPAQDLGVAPYCEDFPLFTNANATASDIGNDNIPDCWGDDLVDRDVWFSFIASDTIQDYTITINGLDGPNGSINTPQIAIYRGACMFDELALLACGSADPGLTTFEFDLFDLDPGETYFIRINDYAAGGGNNSGDFTLCVEEIEPVNTIDQGGSTACTGLLYDSGGPDGDYSNNEDFTFTICPPFGNNACVTFMLNYYNLDVANGAFGDQLIFYDGPNINSPVIDELSGDGFGDPTVGGTCFKVQASSGCLTVQFQSDGFLTLEGFEGAWECSAQPCVEDIPITITPNASEAEIVDFVSSPQTVVTLDTINCAQGAYGTFMAPDNSDLGISRGLILTSGQADIAVGPNTDFGAGVENFPSQFDNPPDIGDSDLNYLSSTLGDGSLSFDACIVELDVFVQTNELTFEYIFGSEEYPEFVNSTFNDIFAFFISGPGITGDPNIANQENIAIIPGTINPVQINSVNSALNWEYYRDNEGGPSVEYDGLTSDFQAIKKSLTARSTVTPCETYHLKLAISDRGDEILDSGVFISEIRGGRPQIEVQFNSGINYFIEGCSGVDDELVVSLLSPVDDTTRFVVNISGTATIDSDYTLSIPDTIVLLPGETSISFPIIPIDDMMPEGDETIIISLTNNFGCGDVIYETITIDLREEPEIEISGGLDTIYVCTDSCVQLTASGAVDYFWTPVSIIDTVDSATPIACPSVSGYVFVSGDVGGCVAEDSVWLQLVDPVIEITTDDPTSICQGDSVVLVANNNVNDFGLSWSPTGSLGNPDTSTVVARPQVPTTYTAQLDINGCIVTDQIEILVDEFVFPEVIPDTTVCQGTPIQLATQITGTTTQYQWTPEDGLDFPDSTGATVIADQDITYTLVATSLNNFCSDTAEVSLTVLPAEIDIIPQDTVFICLGDQAVLFAQTSGDPATISWTPTDSIDVTSGPTVVVNPSQSGYYFADITIGICDVRDSVFVQVDSLPQNTGIMSIPEKDPYCAGELISLTSENYDEDDYPNISFLWSPDIGAQTALNGYNLLVAPPDTTTYIRTNENGACISTDTITVNVIPASDITVNADQTDICRGESIQLTATSMGADEYNWTAANGTFSCQDCPDPIFTPEDDVTVSVEGDIEGCPVFGSIAIRVVGDPPYQFPIDSDLCLGESITLNGTFPQEPGTTWSWTSDPPGFVSDIENPTVTPNINTTYILTIDNGICPPVTDQFSINVIDPNLITFSVDPTQDICEGETIAIGAMGSAVGSYVWEPGGLTGSTVEVSPNDTTLYNVTYTTPCRTFTDQVLVNVTELVTGQIVLSADSLGVNTLGEVAEGDSVFVRFLPDFPIPPGSTVVWLDAEGNQVATGLTALIIASDDPTEFMVQIIRADGCFNEYEESFPVIPAQYAMPNIFTPNDDRVNDVFQPFVSGAMEIDRFSIYNRRGQKIYDSIDFPNDPPAWDGTHNDRAAPADVYIYIIELVSPSGNIFQEKGEVTLVR